MTGSSPAVRGMAWMALTGFLFILLNTIMKTLSPTPSSACATSPVSPSTSMRRSKPNARPSHSIAARASS